MTIRKLISLFLISLWLMPMAATRTWDNGAGTGIWSTAANWSDDTRPTAADDIVLDATSTANLTVDSNAVWNTFSKTAAYTGNIYFGATVDTTRGNMSLLGDANDTVFLQTSKQVFKGDWKCGITIVRGTSTLAANGASGTQTIKCAGLYYDVEHIGAAALVDSGGLRLDDLTRTGAGVMNLLKKVTSSGNVTIDGAGALTALDTIQMDGASSTLHIGGTVGTVTATAATVVMNTATAGVIDDDKGVTFKRLVIGASDTVVNSGAAVSYYDNPGNTTLILGESALLTISKAFGLYAKGTCTPYSIATGASVTGGSSLNIYLNTTNGTVTLPAFTRVGLGNFVVVPLSNTFTINQTGNISVLANYFIDADGGSTNLTYNALANITCAELRCGSTGNATSVFNWGSSDRTHALNSFNSAGTYAVGTTTQNFDTANFIVSGNVVIPSTHTTNAKKSKWTIDSIATITSNGKTWGDSIHVNAGDKKRVSLVDSLTTRALVVADGVFDHNGKKVNVTGSYDHNGDTLNAKTYSQLSVTGLPGRFHTGASTVNNIDSLTLYYGAQTGTLDIDQASLFDTLLQIVIAEACTVTNTSDAAVGVLNAGDTCLIVRANGVLNLGTEIYIFVTGGSCTPYSFGTGHDISGVSALNAYFLKAAGTIDIPAIRRTGLGSFKLIVRSNTFTMNQSGAISLAERMDINSDGATSALTYNTKGFNIACKDFQIGATNSANLTLNLGAASDLNITSWSSEVSLNTGTTTVNDSAQTTAATGFVWQTTHTHNAATGQSLTLTGNGALTSAGKYRPKKIVVSGGARTGADAIYTDSLSVTGGSLALGGAGTDTVALYCGIDGGTLDVSADTMVLKKVYGWTGDLIKDAATLWKILGGGSITGFDGDTLPKTQFLGGGGF